MTVAYMVSAYPARSHTFIKREIEELERQGFSVNRYSQRRCAETEILNQQERQEYNNTWSVFPLSLFAVLLAHLQAIGLRPRQYFSTLVFSIKYRPPGTLGILYSAYYFFQAIYVAKKMQADGISVVHMHFVNSGGYVGIFAARFLQLPWGVSVHGRSDFDYPGVHALRWVIKEGDFLRCISRFGASQAMRQNDAKYWDKVFVSYCGLPDTWLEKNQNIQSKNQTKIILSVGRLSAEKGQFLLLKMAAYLKSENTDFRLQIIGSGPDQQQLEADAVRLGVAELCDFLGAKDETAVKQAMICADVFVCPSLMEGLPQVLMEAMAVKLPVVAPYLAGIPELVTNKETGMLFPAGDWRKMSEAVALLLTSEKLANQCIELGYEVLTNHYVLSKTICPLVNVLTGFDRKATNKHGLTESR